MRKPIETPEDGFSFMIERAVDPAFVSIPEAARLTGVSRYMLRRLIHEGKLPCLRIGSPDRFLFKVDREALLAYLRQEASRGPVER